MTRRGRGRPRRPRRLRPPAGAAPAPADHAARHRRRGRRVAGGHGDLRSARPLRRRPDARTARPDGADVRLPRRHPPGGRPDERPARRRAADAGARDGQPGRHPRHPRDEDRAGRRRGRRPAADAAWAGPCARARPGPGQPGNSAIVARRSAFGGPFRPLGSLELGDEILVTTTQGQSIYVVTEVRSDEVADGAGTGRNRPRPRRRPRRRRPLRPPRRRRCRSAPPRRRRRPVLDAALPEGALTTDDAVRADRRRPAHAGHLGGHPAVEHRAGHHRDRRDARPAVPAHAAVGAHGAAGRPRRRRQRLGAADARGPGLPGGRRARPSSSTAGPVPARPTSSPPRPLVAATILTAEAVARLLPAWT